MAFESSIFPPGVWCTQPVELVLLLFHVTVALMVGAKLLKRQATFATAFFTLYMLLSAADIGHYLWVGKDTAELTTKFCNVVRLHATHLALWLIQRLETLTECM